MPNFPKTRQKGIIALAIVGGALVVALPIAARQYEEGTKDEIVLQLTARFIGHYTARESMTDTRYASEAKTDDQVTITLQGTSRWKIDRNWSEDMDGARFELVSNTFTVTVTGGGESTIRRTERVNCPPSYAERDLVKTTTTTWTYQGGGNTDSPGFRLSLKGGWFKIEPIDPRYFTEIASPGTMEVISQTCVGTEEKFSMPLSGVGVAPSASWHDPPDLDAVKNLEEKLMRRFKPNQKQFTLSGSASSSYTLPSATGSTDPRRFTSSTTGTFDVSYTLSFNAEPEEVRIKIVNPRSDSEHVFKDKKLVIEAEAKVEPAKYENEVIWEIQDIQGSKKTIEPEKGSKVKITFDKLPSDNNQFGEKTIKAKVRGKQDQVKVRVFFSKDGKDNPEEKYPNWFYYWRQGVVAGLERFEYRPGGSYYDLATQKLYISDNAASNLIGGTVPLRKVVTKRDGTRCTPASIVISPTKGVDSVARVVAHELEHYQRVSDMRLGDYDGDRVATPIEEASPYCLIPIKSPNTHNLKVSDGTPGDDEVLAMAAEAEESRSKSRVRRNLDWACPGSQCKRNR